ncbi:MAG: iron donor protein CyaY [Cellvibrionaceae bacterium]
MNDTLTNDAFISDGEYREKAEALYEQIEEAVDRFAEERDAPMDYENTGGVLTIFLEDTDTQVIISRQAATQQIWVAAKSGGFHCIYVEGHWRCTKTEETLDQLLSRTCSEQTKMDIHFDPFT